MIVIVVLLTAVSVGVALAVSGPIVDRINRRAITHGRLRDQAERERES